MKRDSSIFKYLYLQPAVQVDLRDRKKHRVLLEEIGIDYVKFGE